MCVCVCGCYSGAHVRPLAVVVVSRAMIPQHVLDDVAPSPAGEQHLGMLITDLLQQSFKNAENFRKHFSPQAN